MTESKRDVETGDAQQPDTASISVRNVGGIDETELSFSSGVTVLTGRNATNRTSFLQSVMGALGSDRVTLKGDAEEGHATLEIGGESYTRTLSREGDVVVTGGDPFLGDATLADLFAFLLESNEARRAVGRADDLRDVIMRPVDTEEIRADIRRLESEKRDLDDRLASISSLEDRLPELESRRRRLEDDVEERRDELAATESEIADLDANVEESRAEKAELDEKLDTLHDRRSDLDDVRYEVETQRESLDALREELDELEDQREEMADEFDGDVDELDAEVDRLQSRRTDIDATLDELRSVVQFNRKMLSGTDSEVVAALRDGEGTDGAVTDALLAEEERIVCWTCGSDVERGRVEETIGRLEELRDEKRDEQADVEDRLEDLRERKERVRSRRSERERVENRIGAVEDEIDRRESELDRLEDRREEVASEIESLEAEVDDLETEEFGTVIDLHKEANELEFEIDRLESELDDVTDEIAEVEDRLDDRTDLEDRREGVTEELVDLRTRVDQIETEAVEAFNEHMANVLDVLDYDNIERIWIERTAGDEGAGAGGRSDAAFDLHVVRATASGATYEDTVEHLSESEREVTGLVFALAGYLVHEVYESVPFILLDSLEAIDSSRIAALVDYVSGFSDYLLVALLPEDAAALDESYERVTEI